MRAMSFAAAAASMTVLDIVWMGAVAKNAYRRDLGHLMAPAPRWSAAGLFYLVYAAGIVHFAVGPSSGPREAALQGALLGLLVYLAYDLTNLALLRGWTVRIAILDATWGAFATALSAAAAAYFRR